MTSSSSLLSLALLAAMAVDVSAQAPEVVKKAEQEDANDSAERERRSTEDGEDAHDVATMTPNDPREKKGDVAVLTSGTTAHVPLVAGRLPYNCLHWSFCRTNGWTEPVLLPLGLGPSLRQLLEREGFGTTPVDCSTATGHVCMLIWNVPVDDPPLPPDQLPSDFFWVHAMKRVDGRWSSKNGVRGRWEDIDDTTRFLDRHYPVPAGRTRVIRCFAKR